MSALLVYVSTLLVAGLVTGAHAMDEEMAELARMVRENCVGETGVDESLLTKIDGGADLMPDPKLKCYFKCTMETAGIMSDGVVDVEAIIALIPENLKVKNEGMLRKCDTQKGADDCETAFLTQVCWQNSNKADYFFI